jgi:hypothetical protein
MTQTLDVAGRYSQLGSARAAEAPVTETQSRSKVGTFAITFGIAATLLYTVFERLNWPLFTYLPRVNRVEFWLYRSPPAESPPMYWYGWIVLAGSSAFVLALMARSASSLRRSISSAYWGAAASPILHRRPSHQRGKCIRSAFAPAVLSGTT